jgi:hypothetical protein
MNARSRKEHIRLSYMLVCRPWWREALLARRHIRLSYMLEVISYFAASFWRTKVSLGENNQLGE